MITPQEYVDRFGMSPPPVMWVHGLDLLQHCMQGDINQTFFRDDRPEQNLLWALQKELEEHSSLEKDNLNKVFEDGLQEKPKWRRRDDFSGDLDIDRLIADRTGTSPVFNSYSKDKKHKPAINLLLDMEIPWMERGSNEMIYRHKEIYELTVQAVNEGRPCRVVACGRFSITESPRYITLFIVIKDFTDPIFAGIWGAFKTNASTNSFLNVLMDYWIGTRHRGNGCSEEMRASEHFVENEVKIINGHRVRL